MKTKGIMCFSLKRGAVARREIGKCKVYYKTGLSRLKRDANFKVTDKYS